jgi:hypothetical protein
MGNGALPNGPSYRAHPRLYPAPAVDRVNVRESLFAAAFNGLLQQNLPKAVMHCSKDSGVPYRLPAKLM